MSKASRCGAFLLCLTLPLGATLLAAADAPRAKRFELEDLGKLVRLSSPQIAPDGKSIALVVSRPDYEKNRFNSELVLVDAATGARRVLVRDRHGVSHPRWSPSGDRLAFLAHTGPE